MGNRFGYAAAVLSSKQFITAFNSVCEEDDELEDDWEFLIPSRPVTINPAINDATGDNERRRFTAEWNEFIKQCIDGLSSNEMLLAGAPMSTDCHQQCHCPQLQRSAIGRGSYETMRNPAPMKCHAVALTKQ